MNKTLRTLVWVVFVAVFCSCSMNSASDNPTRKEFIKVYEESPDKLLDGIEIPVEGAQDAKIHVLSNVPLQWKYLPNPNSTETDWLTIKSIEEVESGHVVVTYDAQSLLAKNSLEQRSVRLSFSSPEAFLGKFLVLSQGHDILVTDDFSTELGGALSLTGKQTYTTREFPEVNTDHYEFITFNAWAETDNEFPKKNITLDVTVSGGMFYETRLTTHRINVPLGTSPDESNFKYILVMGSKDDRMSAKTNFTFSVENDDQVVVHVDDFAIYTVSPAYLEFLYQDEYIYEEEGDGELDWE